MNPKISTLENVEKSEIVQTFNSAFENYFVKIELNEKTLTEKIAAENISLEKSVGAFAGDKLVGFILIGIDDFNGLKTAYNGGTGVIPTFRGNDLTGKMYEFLLPKLAAENINFHLLEVITENNSAIKSYEKIGFGINRTLACFKGKISPSKVNSDIEIKLPDEIDEQAFSEFLNSRPSWQNSFSAIERTLNSHKIAVAFSQKTPVAYAIYTKTGRIKQFAVRKDFRHRGIGQSLFSFIGSGLDEPEFTITNVDRTDTETINFLSKIGLEIFLEQLEMTLTYR